MIEDYRPEDTEPTAQDPSYDFDWDGLFKNLGEEQAEPFDYSAMATVLKRIFDFVLDVDLSKRDAPRMIGRRVMMLAWVMDPKRFENASLRKLAESLGSSAAHLSAIAAGISRDTGISNRFQAHDWRKKS